MTHRKKLLITINVLSITFLAELVGGLISGSLSLVADSVHVFSDAFSLILAFAAMSIAHRKMPTDRMTFGYHRLEVFSALFNGGTLVAISLFVLFYAVQRYLHPQAVKAWTAMTIAVIGLGVNVISALILRSDVGRDNDINLRSAYLHVLGDALASVAVIVGMVVIAFTRLVFIDAIVAALISFVILYSAIRVLIEGTGILLQQAPADVGPIREKVRRIDHVLDIQDVRLWRVCSVLAVGTAHVITDVERLEETEPIYDQVVSVLEQECCTRHLTLQFETPAMSKRHSHEFNHQHDVGSDEHPHH
jgi:cobalt-zinc-cadmium efflux system protein